MPFFQHQAQNHAETKKRVRGNWWKWLKVAFVSGICLALAGILILTVFAAYVSRDLPDPNVLTSRSIAQSTKIYDRTGQHLLYEIHGDENRTLVKIEDIPLEMQHATVAVEDRDFYNHHGIYWFGLMRAVIVNTLQGRRISGTSTLTQQLVKNALLTNERSLLRKVKEFILSMQIERTYSKDQILQMYLNEIPYGSTVYGVEAASQTYFGKPAKDLSLDEAALLAAIPQSPDYYNPYGAGVHGDHRSDLVIRQHLILNMMADQGYITKDQRDEAKKTDTLAKLKPQKIGNISAPHFVMYVKQLLIDKYGSDAVTNGGYKVVTTLDWDKQQAAEEEVTNGVNALGKKYKFSNAALISLDPKTGQVLAMVGSKDYFDNTIDGQVNVTLSPRQPGSSFKPIIYAAGFIRGYLPETQLWDVETNFKTDTTDYHPHDYDGKERGPVSVRQALQGSLNIPAVKMLYLVGIGRAIDFAQSLGYTTFSDRSRFGLSFALGGGEVKPIEHAAAFEAFANEGIQYPTTAILEVDDSKGNVLDQWQPSSGTRVMDAQIARQVSNVLSDNQARAYVFGSANSLTLPDRPVAAKTGTTNDNKDAWTAGYTPNLVTIVWVGNSKGQAMAAGADGSIIAAPIWNKYMKRAVKGTPVAPFVKPDAPTTTKPAILGQTIKQTLKIDRISGKLATDFTPAEDVVMQDFFVAHDILHYVDKDDPLGPAPTNPFNDPQYQPWEAGVSAWVLKTQWNATSTAPTTYDDVHTANSTPVVTLFSPGNGQVISSQDFTIQAGVQSSRRIVRMEAMLNNQPVAVQTTEPWNLQAHIPSSMQPGTYELDLTAIDEVGNRGTTRVDVTVTVPSTSVGSTDQGEVRILSPFNDVVWSRATFPQAIDLSIATPSAYSHIDVSFIAGDGGEILVHSETNPSQPSLHITIPAGPAAGRYRLMVKGYHANGTIEEDSVFITVGV